MTEKTEIDLEKEERKEEEEKENQEENNELHFEFVIERPDVIMGTTESDTAKLIQQLDANDPEWLSKTKDLIKRFVHHEKLSVYSRIFRYTEKGTYVPSFFTDFLENKIETHRKLYADMSYEIENWENESHESHEKHE